MKNDNIFYLSKGFEREKSLRYLKGFKSLSNLKSPPEKTNILFDF